MRLGVGVGVRRRFPEGVFLDQGGDSLVSPAVLLHLGAQRRVLLSRLIEK